MSRRFPMLLTAAMLTFGLGTSTDALAQARRAAPAERSAPVRAKVDLEIRVVYATTAHSRVDSRLSSLTRYLEENGSG